MLCTEETPCESEVQKDNGENLLGEYVHASLRRGLLKVGIRRKDSQLLRSYGRGTVQGIRETGIWVKHLSWSFGLWNMSDRYPGRADSHNVAQEYFYDVMNGRPLGGVVRQLENWKWKIENYFETFIVFSTWIWQKIWVISHLVSPGPFLGF